MGKAKKYFVIYKGKRREIAKQEKTSKGIYTIPTPEIQKEFGSDLHFSYEADGEIQHIKSRKFNYEKEGSLFGISSDVFQSISEPSSITDVPKEVKGVVITPFKIQELVNKHSSSFSRLGWEYFNLDKFFIDLNQEEAVELENIDKVPQDKIAFFFTEDYVFYYFNHEFKKIKTEHFYLLKKYEDPSYG